MNTAATIAPPVVHTFSCTSLHTCHQVKEVHFGLTKRWWKEIASGRKSVEMRAQSVHWKSRIPNATHAVFKVGSLSICLFFVVFAMFLMVFVGPFADIVLVRQRDGLNCV